MAEENVQEVTEVKEEETLERCFWCGLPKDKTVSDEQITKMRPVIHDYRPCEACKEKFNGGIHVIGVTDKPIVQGMFPISKSDNGDCLYPTGSMFVATDEFVKDLLPEEENKELKENVLRERILMLPEEVVSNIVEEARKAQAGEDITPTEEVSNEENIQNQSDKENMA